MRVTRFLRAPQPSRTGFDPKAFAAASGTPANDPWARRVDSESTVARSSAAALTAYREAWRYNGPFSRFNRFKGSFPGLGIATVAFAGYCAYEYLFLNDDHAHGHEAAHEEGHH